MVGLFLKVFGFVEKADVQSVQAQLGIKLVLGIAPSILILIGIIALVFYPITRTEHARIVAALAERQAARGQGMGM